MKFSNKTKKCHAALVAVSNNCCIGKTLDRSRNALRLCGMTLQSFTLKRHCEAGNCKINKGTPPKQSYAKAAFTLAEVLITLGIIGVVAAMTIPTLMGNIQKQQTAVRVKKFYAELTQAVEMAKLDHGPISDWTYGTAFDGPSAVTFANTYLVPYLKVAKNCGTGTGCRSGEVYSRSGTINVGYGDSGTASARFLTNSGYSVGVVSGGTYVNIQVSIAPKNSTKLVMGKDIFFFIIEPKYKTNGLTTHGLYKLDASNNPILRTRDELLDNSYKWGCNQSAGQGAGMSCTALMQLDNWELKDDYPW